MGAALFFMIALLVFLTGVLVLGFTFHHWFVSAQKKRNLEAVKIDSQNANTKSV